MRGAEQPPERGGEAVERERELHAVPRERESVRVIQKL